MPGERVEDIDREFLDWIASLANAPGSPFRQPPDVAFPLRWLPGSAISTEESSGDGARGLRHARDGKVPPLAGIEGPCDMYVFQPSLTRRLFYGAPEVEIPMPQMSM